jgi:hypothetical protein
MRTLRVVPDKDIYIIYITYFGHTEIIEVDDVDISKLLTKEVVGHA